MDEPVPADIWGWSDSSGKDDRPGLSGGEVGKHLSLGPGTIACVSMWNQSRIDKKLHASRTEFLDDMVNLEI